MNGLKRNLKGLLFISPWLSVLNFWRVPDGMAIYLSFTNYNILQPATTKFIGLAKPDAHDQRFRFLEVARQYWLDERVSASPLRLCWAC